MTNVIVRHATVITMDSDRRVIEDGAIAVEGSRIVAVGADSEVANASAGSTEIDGRYMVAIPGLIDCHSHAGHALVKSLGAGMTDVWYNACAEIYAKGSTESFWQAEAGLASLERLKAGVTTCITLLGGGADIMRTDDPVYGDLHCQVTAQSGLRCFLAIGPGRPPFPKLFARLDAAGAHPYEVTMERQFEVCEAHINKWHGTEDGRVNICLILPVFSPDEMAGQEVRSVARQMSEIVESLMKRYDVLFTQDGHRTGSLAALAEVSNLLGPRALMSHSVDLTEADINTVVESGARIVHNPSAIMSIYGRCPVPELLDAGVTVALGSDAAAPDRGFDMFRHMAQCLHYHRRHFRDPKVLSPGKVLEMCTIDAAHALGLGDEIGSLEVGKRADIVLLNMRKPHLYPLNMPVTRVVHFANAADVDTVIVNGRMLMSGRKVLSMNEDEILDHAQREIDAALARTKLSDLTIEPAGYWRQA